jgi:DNA-binding response OmpR family regulator
MALMTIQRELPDLVLLDLMVPKIAGDEILKRMRSSSWGKNIKVLIISNLNEADAPAGLREQGIAGYVVKANLANDQLDQLVAGILNPTNQADGTSLETGPPPMAQPSPPPSPPTPPTQAPPPETPPAQA